MSAKDYLKEYRVYEDESIYNSVGEIVGTVSQLMDEYADHVNPENATLKAQRDELLEVLTELYELYSIRNPKQWKRAEKAIENCK